MADQSEEEKGWIISSPTPSRPWLSGFGLILSLKLQFISGTSVSSPAVLDPDLFFFFFNTRTYVYYRERERERARACARGIRSLEYKVTNLKASYVLL